MLSFILIYFFLVYLNKGLVSLDDGRIFVNYLLLCVVISFILFMRFVERYSWVGFELVELILWKCFGIRSD